MGEMVRKICLDSDVLVELLAGNKETRALVEHLEGDFYSTAINVFELWFGRKESEKIFKLLAWLYICKFDESAAKKAADILRTLKKDGSMLELRDLFVAAICIVNDLELLTYNKAHFEKLKKFGLVLV